MKKEKITHFCAVAVFCILFISTTQAQVQFQGLISQNEGAAGWDADGTGPEPYGNGHETYVYYTATRDYVDPESAYGGHVTSIADDFPAFAQALTDYDFTPQMVNSRMGLASQGTDLQGIDWFSFGSEEYMNFYPADITLYLDGEPMIKGLANYMIYHMGPSTAYEIICVSNYFTPEDASALSSPEVQAVAAAFLEDVGMDEMKLTTQTFGSTQQFSGNGRIGRYYNYNGTLEKGFPKLPFNGLAANHEGFAGWDADGTGPEPKRQGHTLAPEVNQRYYIASVDYDDIDPDPAAAFVRLLDEGIDGFENLKLQLAYRGFSFEQVKFKMGLRSLDEDVFGEDWWLDTTIHNKNIIHHTNFYQSVILAEINGEPLFGYVCDTNQACFDLANPYNGWEAQTANAIPYDASENSPDDVKMVAMSFFKDLESRQIHSKCEYINSTGQTFSGNGRAGIFLEIIDAHMIATPPRGTAIQPGNISGQWTLTGHPYIVTGDITIPNGQTLVIDPGVWIKFTDRVQFKVDGSIQAIGDSGNTGSIAFTAVNPELGWGHFVFDSTALTNEASVFSHCIFEYGYAPEAVPLSEPTNCGGAIGIRAYDNIIIENCLFRNNRALYDADWIASGGAIALWTSSPVIRNCVFSNNSANWSGAISCTFGSSPDIVNCLFYGNKSLKNIYYGGGAMLVGADSNPRLLNNTFVNNHSNFRGGALEIFNGSNPDLINNIFWGNTAPQNNQIYISSNDCNVDFKYNDIEGGEAGIGPFGIGAGVYENNLEVDPSFADQLALDFQLSEGSPCIDAGIPDVTGLSLPPNDLLGNVRIWDGGSGGERIDMGAYEFNAPLYVGIHNPGTLQNSKFQVQCFPNPFSDFTFISIDLPEPTLVTLQIYNLTGGLVDELHNSRLPAGNHHLWYNAGNLPDGLYFLSIKTGTESTAIKLIRN